VTPHAVTAERLRDVLRSTLPGAEVDVRDDSHLHAGHAGAREGRHFAVRVVSPAFAGLARVARHRLVYDAARSLIAEGIHALAIEEARTPAEAPR
jgi:BolA family transcriptional regulator, general stress-responsive regulator